MQPNLPGYILNPLSPLLIHPASFSQPPYNNFSLFSAGTKRMVVRVCWTLRSRMIFHIVVSVLTLIHTVLNACLLTFSFIRQSKKHENSFPLDIQS
jgi:hypothetical protein